MTAAAHRLNGSSAVNRGLRRYAEALGHRHSLRRVLGRDVDPDRCLADFIFSIGTKNTDRLTRVYDSSRTKAALGHPSGPSGGYLVPQDLGLELMQDVAEEALVRPRATVVQMDAYTLRLPLPDATTAQAAGITPFFGGIQMKWTSEGATRPETEPTFRAVDLTAWDLTGYALQSNSFLADGGPGLEAYFRTLFARSIAWYEDYAYLRGDGIGMPMGLLNNPGTTFVSRGTSSHVNAVDIGKMSVALLPASWGRAIWVVSPGVWADLIALGGTAGVSPSWQINQPIAEGKGAPHFILNGQGGYVSEKLPALGTRGDIILFDPMLYVIGDRQAVEIDVSFDEPTAFTKNQAVWRVIYRGDGQPWFNRAITLQDAATSVSPYVSLAT